MANPIKGIDRIDARILAEAESYAAAQADEAEKQAQALLDAQRRKTAAKTEEILSRARTQAQALTESAESSAGMREPAAAPAAYKPDEHSSLLKNQHRVCRRFRRLFGVRPARRKKRAASGDIAVDFFEGSLYNVP